MPLYEQVDLLCQAVLTQGREEAEKILQQARTQADHLETAEKGREQEVLERTRKEVQARAHHDARNLVDRASLESKRRVAEAKEVVMNRVFELARARLLAFRDSPEYPDWLRKMLLKAVSELGGGSCRLVAHPEDASRLTADLLDEVSRETGVSLELATDGQASPGGFLALSADGRLRYDATFQGILDRKRDSLRTELAKLLWQAEER
ncbi:MAG: V-type ATP synthase subunit E [Syntrophobacterales bacterium]|jgi:vacuolar-type H+-ATPase subunit E/Vma4